MPSTTTFSFGDVVLVAFPFTNLQSTKKRPAVIISSAAYQQERPDVILMAITSQIRQPMPTGEAILQDWRAAGLPKPSALKPLIATIEQTRSQNFGKIVEGRSDKSRGRPSIHFGAVEAECSVVDGSVLRIASGDAIIALDGVEQHL
jgi:mRNA interferase MazF